MSDLLKNGRLLQPGEVATMEQYVAEHPDDLKVRTQLVTYYYAHGVRQPRIDHILWLIANHPESPATIFNARGLTPRTTSLNDAADFTRAAELWRQQAAAHPTDARVLGNAGVFFAQPGGDYDEAERLLIAASRVDLSGDWVRGLGRLYAASILADSGDPLFPGGNSAFAAHARTLLEATRDIDLATGAGVVLTSVAKRSEPGRSLPSGVLDLNQHPLLVSAVDFGQRLMDRFSSPALLVSPPAGVSVAAPPPPPGVRAGVIGGVIAGVPGGVAAPPRPAAVRDGVIGGVIAGVPANATPPPPPPPSADSQPVVQRVKIGGQVIAANLIRKVPPVYPEEAKAAGIEGDVVLKILIAADGHVESAEPTDGNPVLAAAAVEAVLQWLYKPTLLNNQPVQVATTVTLSFRSAMPADLPAFHASSTPDQVNRTQAGGFLQPAMLVRKAGAVYPEEARAAGIVGDVVLKVVIDANGRVIRAEPMDGNPILAAAAVDAVLKWFYRPALLNGTPVQSDVTVTLAFRNGVSAGAPSPSPQAGGRIQTTVLLRKVSPVYPEEARAEGIEGDVVLMVVVAADGHVKSAKPIGGDPILAAAAVEAVLQWFYKPTLLNGTPIESDNRVTLTFRK
jgi:TonB family protein